MGKYLCEDFLSDFVFSNEAVFHVSGPISLVYSVCGLGKYLQYGAKVNIAFFAFLASTVHGPLFFAERIFTGTA